MSQPVHLNYRYFKFNQARKSSGFWDLNSSRRKKDSYPLVICMHGSMGWGISSQDHS